MKLFDWSKRKRRLTALDYAAGKVKNQRDDFVREAEAGLRRLYRTRRSLRRRMAIMDERPMIVTSIALPRTRTYAVPLRQERRIPFRVLKPELCIALSISVLRDY